MATNILSIGQSALNAAQVGISTTGHNIANASTPGYSRQVVVQTAAQAQNFGYGYVGQGTEVTSVSRVFSELLARQVINSQSVSASVNTYADQMTTIDTMLSDASAGLTPAMQDFFGSMQDLTANPSDVPTRQAMISNAQSLVNRFKTTSARLNELREGVNTALTASVEQVNAYGREISRLNDVIEKAISADGHTPNDLMDKRDQLVNELSKQIKTTVVQQNQGSYNIFVGNGLPLVVGNDTFSLETVKSPTDASRLEVAYVNKAKSTVLSVDSLQGGAIGGLVEFRAKSLDTAQNQIGQLAVALAGSFNLQHQQGLDKSGQLGGNLFDLPAPAVGASSLNSGTATLSVAFTDPRAVTSSDYRLQYDGTNFIVTRLSDSQVSTYTSLPQTLDGISISHASGSFAAGDDFVISPTRNAATSLNLAFSDVTKLAVGAPAVAGTVVSSNTGTGKISAPQVSSSYASSPLAAAFTLSYNSGTNELSGFPATAAVTVTTSSGTSTTYAAGSPVTYSAGSTISVAGVSFAISGSPSNGDQFTVTPNTSTAVGDNRNGLLLADLQNQTLVGNIKSVASAFGQIVNSVGNKTRELQVTGEAEKVVLEQATAAMQSESGVNLDEEATNLLRYQQAYQAAGKMMQIASQLFQVLLQLGQG